MYMLNKSSKVQFMSNLWAYIQQLKRENVAASSSARMRVLGDAAVAVAEKGPVRAARK